MYANFKTKKQLKAYIREVIDEIGLCPSISKYHPEHMELFMFLFKRHYRYPEKFYGLVDVKIIYSPEFGKPQLEVWIIKDDGTEDNVSVLNKCITGRS